MGDETRARALERLWSKFRIGAGDVDCPARGWMEKAVWSEDRDSTELLRLLLEAGASAWRGEAAEHLGSLAAVSNVVDPVAKIRLLVGAGADVNGCDEDGWTALHNAAFSCDSSTPERMRALLELGADVNARVASDGRSALHVVAAQGFLASAPKVRLLLAAGADPGAVDAWGRTPAEVVGTRALPWDKARVVAVVAEFVAARK